MNFLFCSQLYHPSAGGVQTVMRQVAERLVSYGHSVTIATSKLKNRSFSELNGVKIVEFSSFGNLVLGMHGEIEKFREFIRSFPCDAILINAVEQWTFDALIPFLDSIKVRKVLIPCGFISFYDPSYEKYYSELHCALSKFDALIFHSTNYRDINYAHKYEIDNCVIIPNGASGLEFVQALGDTFRIRHQIAKSDFLILTVGAFSGNKGHQELLEALQRLPENGNQIVAIINGNNPYSGILENISEQKNVEHTYIKRSIDMTNLFFGYIRKVFFYLLTNIKNPGKIYLKVKNKLAYKKESQVSCLNSISNIATNINKTFANKRILVADLPRDELIQAYFAADLFVFASHVEYSPLVLFEAAASGTPFLSTDVGNAREIIEWLGGGFICESQVLENGNRIVDPKVLAQEIAMLMLQKDRLKEIGVEMRKNWAKKYTWDHIAREYERVLIGA